jgi:hypothetical protein
MVVADPLEGYNPTHDLCSVIANTAVRCVARKSAATIRSYDYTLTGTADLRGSSASTVMRLPPDIHQRKLAAASGYHSLFAEVAAAVQREGNRAYEEEVLREITTPRDVHAPVEIPPFYETYGERQRAAGRYATVIRYAEHFLPMAQAIAESVASGRDVMRYRGRRYPAREQA